VTTDSSHFLFFSQSIENGVVFLDKDECRHVFSTLRVESDQTIRVTDGRGTLYECRLAQREKDGARFHIERSAHGERQTPEVRVCVGLCDKEEFGGLVQDLAALGAASIVPVVCEYCQSPWWRMWEKHEVRLRGKMIAGIKQSQNVWLPTLAEPTPLSEALAAAQGCPLLVADQNGSPLASAVEAVRGASLASCFVGPPGGFSPQESAQISSAQAYCVALSENRLRTELAAVLLCGVVKSAVATSE
jgi:16S rRNA (uracil1498-N3)-methyltransferase